MVRANVDQETAVRGPFLEQLFRRFGTDVGPVLEEKLVRDSVPGSKALVISGNAGGLAKLLQSSGQLLREGTARRRVVNYHDHGRLGKLAIDHDQLLDDVGGNAKHRELEVAVPGRQAQQFVQRQANNGCRLDGLDVEIGSIGQQHREQSRHRSAAEKAAVDFLSQPVKQHAFESSDDHKVNVVDFRFQFDDGFLRLGIPSARRRRQYPEWPLP